MDKIKSDTVVIIGHSWDLIENGRVNENVFHNLRKFVSLARPSRFLTLHELALEHL
jgi:hypothetical protein